MLELFGGGMRNLLMATFLFGFSIVTHAAGGYFLRDDAWTCQAPGALGDIRAMSKPSARCMPPIVGGTNQIFPVEISGSLVFFCNRLPSTPQTIYCSYARISDVELSNGTPAPVELLRRDTGDVFSKLVPR